MSTDVMKERIAETSPQVYARIGGVLYLIIIVIGFCSEFFVRDKLVVSGDVTATANNIMASESLWRSSIAGELILLVCAVALTMILYVLLRPVNKNLALLAVFFNIVEFPIEAASKLCLFAALFLSGNADYLKAFEPHQLHAHPRPRIRRDDLPHSGACLNRRIVTLPVAHGEGRERPEVERESTRGVWLIFIHDADAVRF